MTPFRLVFIAGCIAVLLGAGYLSYYNIGFSRTPTTALSSIRTGSTGSGSGFGFGRIK